MTFSGRGLYILFSMHVSRLNPFTINNKEKSAGLEKQMFSVGSWV